MATRRKIRKGGRCHRYETMDINLLNEYPTAMEVFRRIGCLQLCRRLQGFHLQVSKDFSASFNGKASKVGIMNLTVTPETISTATGNPRGGEQWFDIIKFTMQDCKEFIKQEHSEIDMTNAIPRSFMKENYAKLLMVIQNYFTCEGRFHMIYSYHLKLLLHFVGKRSLNLPFYLYTSLGKMLDKVQIKTEGSETSLFHHGLIKLLVLEELRRLARDWISFLFMSGYEIDVVTPKKASKPRTTSSPAMAEEVEEENRSSPPEPVNMEAEPLQETDTPQIAPKK